ncbi:MULTISPECIES: DUF4845 domain-containing protein [unclassified Methylophilus]|uniref:DUF4845 domain-containing protein n=1 Tax=unclassified Methylophilus TaxID=2630143 RepID=UPI0006F342B0|nr:MULTISPECIES: DUF4845 domain-containing protein [unclassified Methylophilus]KQT42123.1 hypothetical protein ASG34_04980 [Methylophilus sp. Leaf416]KQT56304.1 hypothetical protein ASG44_04955 [Methylophilus sp. Leaf459]
MKRSHISTQTTAKPQRGLGLIGFLLVLTAVGILGMVALKALPSYMEYFSIQSTVNRLAHDPMLQSDADIRAAFDRQMHVDMIKTVQGRDLTIASGAVAVRYQKTIPLTDTISLLIDFDAASKASQ